MSKEKKKKYYKVVCDEYPKGVIFPEDAKGDALDYAKDCRWYGDEKAYVRAVSMLPSVVNAIPEI